MKARSALVYLLLITVLCASGCSGTWRKKFVRPKKDADKQGPILQPYDYAREFTNKQLYANNYSFWRSSQSELIRSVKAKDGIKRVKSQMGYAVTDIKKMASLLVDEEKAKLQPYILELEEMAKKIEQPNYLNSNSNELSSRLSKHYRSISRNFSYHCMKNLIKPDQA
ncbi:MAG: hypothetical protein PHV77_02815 [Candidatus Omnitrophica bacterium]|jgi:hypothetical protein|nr:hypothetical protein [Candidatus Omnitrophota bacterium]